MFPSHYVRCTICILKFIQPRQKPLEENHFICTEHARPCHYRPRTIQCGRDSHSIYIPAGIVHHLEVIIQADVQGRLNTNIALCCREDLRICGFLVSGAIWYQSTMDSKGHLYADTCIRNTYICMHRCIYISFNIEESKVHHSPCFRDKEIVPLRVTTNPWVCSWSMASL